MRRRKGLVFWSLPNPASRSPARWAIFTDFDGTLSDHDTIDLLVEKHLGADYARSVNERLVGGQLTVRAALQEEFARLSLSAAEIERTLLAGVRLDPALPRLAEFARQREIPFAILSSGMDLLIAPLLAAAGCAAVTLRCNRLHCRPQGGGWRLAIEFLDDSDNGHDKAAELRAARREGRRVIYLGDGFTDVECAREADVLFAKRRLARHCDREGIAYHPLTSCAQVIDYLLAAAGEPSEAEAALGAPKL